MGRKLYQNKYYTGSLRLPDWDYADDGDYFITIRTKDKGNILGKIIDGKMISNSIGMIAMEYMNEIPEHFQHVILHERIVMPDHVHMLLEINKRKCIKSCDVEPHHGLSLQINRPHRGSISIVVNQFKGSVKRYCNKHQIKFSWQSKFYDRIIRDELEFESTRIYIRNNPKNSSHN
ncbi:MAG: transposase [Candidatus Marinimicrobia bacterium]|nr:transposase [Candidatus Neomarinimicrobiota bacterium]